MLTRITRTLAIHMIPLCFCCTPPQTKHHTSPFSKCNVLAVCSLLNEDLPLADNIQDMVEDMRLNRDVRAPTLSVKSNSPFGDELCKLQRIRSLLPNISIQTIHRSPMFTTHAMILKLRWPISTHITFRSCTRCKSRRRWTIAG